MNLVQSKCKVGIMRESKVNSAGRLINIYVDGVKTTSIKNDSTLRLLLTPGHHVLGFGFGSKITSKISLDLSNGEDVNITCYAKGTGIVSALTPVDVCALAESNQTAQARATGSGCLPQVIGLILFLIGLSILGVRFVFYITPIS